MFVLVWRTIICGTVDIYKAVSQFYGLTIDAMW